MTEEYVNLELSEDHETSHEKQNSSYQEQQLSKGEVKIDKGERILFPKADEILQNMSIQNNSDSLQNTLIEHKSDIENVLFCDNTNDETVSTSYIAANSCYTKDVTKKQIAKHVFSTDKQNNYTRGCLFSPDGLCVLTYNEDNIIRLFDCPQDNEVADILKSVNENVQWQPALSVPEAGPIYDVDWYPLMNSADPVTCCLAVTSQYQPVHLYDAYDGHLRATYRCYDLVDEVVAARSLTFDPTGAKLYVGLKNEICIFDVNIPGRTCTKRKTFTSKEDGGLSGIISSIAVNPAMSSIYALGTYSKGLAVYLEPQPHTLCYLDGQKGGITQIKFSHDGTKLLAGGRKDNEILIWDMRNPGQLYGTLRREVNTNQRIYFDIDSSDQYVVSGGTDGVLRMWDIKSPISDQDSSMSILPEYLSDDTLHKDCINGATFNPYSSKMIATSSGQRHHNLDLTAWNYSSDESSDADDENDQCDSSLKLWKFEID